MCAGRVKVCGCLWAIINLAYGGVHFASKMGQLAGNHFITVTSSLEDLEKLGKMTLWEGAQPIRFELA